MVMASFCGECGERFELDARFCGECGTAREDVAIAAPTTSPLNSLGEPSLEALVRDVQATRDPSPPAALLDVDDGTTVLRRSGRPSPAPAGTTLIATLADGRPLPVADSIVIGRDPTSRSVDDCLIQTPASDLAISKTHLALERDAAGLWVVDLYSMNGIELERVDGPRRVLDGGERVLAASGDRIRFGDQLLTVVPRPQEPVRAEGLGQRDDDQTNLIASVTPPAWGDQPGPELIDSVPLPLVVGGISDMAAGATSPHASDPVEALAPRLPQDAPMPMPLAEAPPAQGPPPAAVSVADFGRHAQVSLAILIVGALSWVMLVRSSLAYGDGLSIRGVLGWTAAMWILAGCLVIGYTLVPAQVGLARSAVARTLAAILIASQLVPAQTYDQVPAWVVLVLLPLTLAAMAILGMDLAGSQDRGGLGVGGADGVLLVLVVTSSCFVVTQLAGYYVESIPLMFGVAVTALSIWSLWSLRGARSGWVLPSVLGLLVLAAIGNWTDGLPGTLRSMCLAAATVVALSPALQSGTPWAGLGQIRSTDGPPALGSSPGTGPIAVAWADLMAWLRSSWGAMALVGSLYWLVLGVVLVLSMAILFVPLALLGLPLGIWGSSDSQASDSVMGAAGLAALLWILVGSQLVATAVAQAIGMLSSQALAEAVSEHEGSTRLRAGTLVGRSLSVFVQQFPTVLLYSLGVLAGSLLCIIPGIYLQVRWAFALPMGAREGVRGSTALGGSWRLTEGRAGVTFGVQLIGGLVLTAAMLIGGVVAVATQLVFGTTAIGAVAILVLTSLGATCAAVLVGSLLRQFLAVRPSESAVRAG